MLKTINVVAAIIVKQNTILAARRKPGLHLAGYWEFPGGKVESNESPEAALIRELKEEFNIESAVQYFVGENTHHYGDKTIKLSAFRVEHISGSFELEDHDEIRWLRPDELYELNWAPADIPLIDDFLRIFSINEYYDQFAANYAQETVSMDVAVNLQKFVSKIGDAGHILDLGCGSGRDSKAFLDRGLQVTSVDGSSKLAVIAEKLIGQKVLVELFQNLRFGPIFDGVWACASLLHCPPKDLTQTMSNIHHALKPLGILYISVKWGEVQSVDDKSRLFTYFTQDSLTALLTNEHLFSIEECWIETKPLRDGEQKWLNVLGRKVDIMK
jgi:mutator protein MutT